MKKTLLNTKSILIVLGILFATTINAFTAVTSGNWTSTATWGGAAPTLTVTNQDIIIPTGITVTLDADIYFTAPLFNFTVDGILTNATANSVFITQGNFIGTGTVSIHKISFMSLAINTFSGNLNVKELYNSTSSLAFIAIANISDTLNLDAGNLLLNVNGNLSMLANSTVKINNGSISLNSGVFNSGNNYHVMYIGSSKTAGIELNTVTLQNLTVNLNSTSQNLTLNNNTTVNGDMNVTTGKLFLNGKKLTLNGNLNLGAGCMISSNAASDMVIAGSGTLTSALMFDAVSSINDLTINRTTAGQVKLSSPIIVNGFLNLIDGNLSIESGGSLTASSTSTIHVEQGSLSVNTGTFNGGAAYHVVYTGSTSIGSGIELTGTGLDQVTVNYASNVNKVTINNDITVAGKLDMIKGMLDLNTKNLIINGVISQNANAAFIGNPTSQLELNLTSVTHDTLYFEPSTTNNQTLNQLKIKTSGTTAIVLGSKLIIGSALTFVNGKVELGNNELVILPAASIVGYNNTRYVTSSTGTGALVMNVVSGSPFVIFPIGLTTNYSPASIQQNTTATTGNFSVRVITAGTTPIKVIDRMWLIESTATTIDANVKLAWVAAAELNGFDRTNAYISHYTASAWDLSTATSATASVHSTFELLRSGFTSLSPFTVAQQGEPLKINEISISNEIFLFPNPSKDILNIKLINSTENNRFELLDLVGRTILLSSVNGTENSFNVSALESGYYFIKATNLTTNKTTIKRFIKE